MMRGLYVGRRWKSYLYRKELNWALSYKRRQPSRPPRKRRYSISNRGIISETPLKLLEIHRRSYASECAWAILCGEAKALTNKNSKRETKQILQDRYYFLPQTKRDDFIGEAVTDPPRTLAQIELAQELEVESDSIPIMLSPSGLPQSEPRWLKELIKFRHPAEFDPPIRPRLRRPRKK